MLCLAAHNDEIATLKRCRCLSKKAGVVFLKFSLNELIKIDFFRNILDLISVLLLKGFFFFLSPM